MRPIHLLLAIALISAVTGVGGKVRAQIGGGPGGSADQQQADDDAKKRKRDQEWGATVPGMPLMKNAGPCPYVKVLYDAARYVEFKNDQEASAAVAYTGEIENLASVCAYKSVEPIKVRMKILFALGRGPQATANRKDYTYWVAVTDRNHAILDKESFTLPVVFPAGQDRVMVTDTVEGVTIPRAGVDVSGNNFEILVGFQVTPRMADFNREGKRFRPNAGQTAAQTATAAPTP